MFLLLLSVIYIAFVSLGLPDSLLGSAWPVMHMDIGADVTGAGVIAMVISTCTILASLMSDRLTRRFGTGPVTAFSVLLTAVAMLLFSFANAFWQLILFAIPYGLGAGAIDSALNNYAALNLKARHMSWLHCFWGIGATLSPYIMGFALSGPYSWHGGYRFVSFIQFGLTVIMFLTLPLWKKAAPSVPENQNPSEENKTLSLGQIFKLKNSVPYFLAFFFYCVIEQLPFVYASSFFVDVFATPEETAAFLASLFYIGMTVSRVITGFLADRFTDRELIRIGIGIVFVSAVLILLPLKTPVCAIIGFVLIGIGSGPVYPGFVHQVPHLFGRNVSGSVIGVQMAFGYTSFTLAPLLFGALTKLCGGFWILPLSIMACAAIALGLTEYINKKQKPE